MKINVHVKEKTILVQCGEGTQKVKWLGHVGIARYDNTHGLELGVPKGIRLENGSQLPMADPINTTLEDDAHVWVVLRDDLED